MMSFVTALLKGVLILLLYLTSYYIILYYYIILSVGFSSEIKHYFMSVDYLFPANEVWQPVNIACKLLGMNTAAHLLIFYTHQ